MIGRIVLGGGIAAAAAARGWQVKLVSGPVSLPCPAGVERVDVVTKEEQQEEKAPITPLA